MSLSCFAQKLDLPFPREGEIFPIAHYVTSIRAAASSFVSLPQLFVAL